MTMTEIATSEAMREFLQQVDSFHDALIRECGLTARGFVDKDYYLHGDAEPFDARVFLQTQASEVPGIEIEFEGVERFCVDQPFDLRPSGSIESGEVRFSFTTSASHEPQIIASAMRYRFLDSAYLGEKPLVTAPKPTG